MQCGAPSPRAEIDGLPAVGPLSQRKSPPAVGAEGLSNCVGGLDETAYFTSSLSHFCKQDSLFCTEYKLVRVDLLKPTYIGSNLSKADVSTAVNTDVNTDVNTAVSTPSP